MPLTLPKSLLIKSSTIGVFLFSQPVIRLIFPRLMAKSFSSSRYWARKISCLAFEETAMASPEPVNSARIGTLTV